MVASEADLIAAVVMGASVIAEVVVAGFQAAMEEDSNLKATLAMEAVVASNLRMGSAMDMVHKRMVMQEDSNPTIAREASQRPLYHLYHRLLNFSSVSVVIFI